MSQTAPRKDDRMAGYVTVAERIGEFYELHINGRIVTTIIEHDAERGFILMRAEVFRERDDAMPAATGHAYEVKDSGPVNRTSYIENCETGCVGRALQNLGLETKRGQGTARPSQQSATQQAPRAIPTASPQVPKGAAATEAQKRQILDLWNDLTAADVFADSAAWQKDLIDHTGAASREELTEAVANAYITSLQRLLRETHAQADKRAKEEEAR